MKSTKELINKLAIIRFILNLKYEMRDVVNESTIDDLLAYSVVDLEILLRDIKIRNILEGNDNEDTKRD